MHRASKELCSAHARTSRFSSSGRGSRIWWANGLLALVLLAGDATTTVLAQSLGRAAMFDAANLPTGDAVTNELGAKRARFIRVNSPVLMADGSPLHQPAPAHWNLDSSRIELNFFDDTRFTAAIEKTLYRNSSNFIARGVIDGWAQSQIILVANGDLVSASIRLPGLGNYSIRPAGDGLHKVIELDLDRIPSCGPLKKAPAKPRPIVIRRKNAPPVRGSDPGGFAPKSDLALAGVPRLDQLMVEPVIEADASSNTNVDVMVVYTASARAGAGGTDAMNTLIDLIIAEANEAYDNSLVPITINLVFRGEVTYTESGNAATDLTRLQNPNDGHMDAVHTQRNQYGADLVCLLTESMATYAGLGYLMSTVSTNFSSYAFSVVRRIFASGTETFAHELGHNMGCAHDRQNSTTRGAYDYSYGHRFTGGDNNVYRTIMAYSPGTRIPYFSNPNVTYLGTATGVATNATNAAHNALSLSNTAPTVAAFRLPVVLFSTVVNSNSVSETNGPITINVSRRSLTNTSATVDFTISGGSATYDVDYVGTNGTLTFDPGEISQSVVVSIVNDGLRENTEAFVFRLQNPSAGGIFSSNTTVYVTDDDASEVGFADAAGVANEGDSTVSIVLERTGSTNTTVSVNYFTTNGTAAVTSDFISTNGTVLFAPGETNKTISVAIVNDTLPETNETFFVRLRSPTNTALVSPTNFTVTIITNDSSVMSFTATTNLLNESHGTLTVAIIRTGTTNNTASVDFFSTNVTATAGDDYTATNGTATFAPGVTTNTFTVAIDDDDSLEPTETFRLVLTNPSDGTIGVRTNTVSLFDNDANSVGFDTNAVALVETNDSVTLTVIRTGATNTAVSVDYRTINGTALTGSDYTTNGGTLTFAAGETTNTIEVDLIDNALQESTETFQVRLINATNCTLAVATNTVSITDDDGTITGFDVASLGVAENTNSVTIRVVRTGATNTEVSLAYATLTNGTATVGSDFRATNGVLVFAAGVTTNTFALAVINDLLPENNETINLRLTSATNTTLGTNNLTVTILTNDSSVMSFTATTNLLSESAGTLTVTVIRTGTTNNAASVDFFSTNVTATAGDDYTATNGTATFAPGVTTNTFTVAIDDDDSLEPTETFRLVLTNPSDGTISIGTNTVSLFDNDANAVGFDTNAVALVETNDSVTLTVIRTGATNTAVTLDYRTINGTALTGSDYTTNGGTLTFAAGETTNTIEVDLIDNALQESTETFQVRLSNISNANLGVGTNTVSITDDDGTTTGFDVASLSVAENTNSVTIRVVRTGATNTEVSLAYATLTNGTATVGSDFRATNGVLVFVAGVTTNTFALAIINDLLPENNETINLRLTSATNTTLGTNNLTVTILTNDSSVMSFTATTNLLSESAGTLTVAIIRTGTTNNTASVDFFSTNVTATAGDDYTATNGTATFAPGVTTNTFTVAIDDDDSLEPTETFRLVLTNPSDGTIGVRTNTVSLFDNDANSVGFDTNAVALVETNDSVTLTVIRTGATNTAVTLDYRTINGTALTGSDYTTNGGTLTFAAGETTNTIEINLIDNALQEATETFQVRLSNATNCTLAVATNTVSITDDDGTTTGFDVASLSVAENTNSVTIRVVRTGATNTEVSLAYATLTNGTATVGSDFRATNGVLVFAAGVTTNIFALAVINDLLPENNETINLRLTSATNTTLGTNNLTVTILTNDSSVMSFTATTNLLSESAGTLTVTVIRTGTTNNTASVDFFSTNVTATAGDDYTATNGTATFAPGVTTNTFTVAIDDDDSLEPTETFRLVLTNPSDGTIGVGTNTVSLFDNDANAVGFDTNAVALVETNDSVTLTVIRTGATNTAVSVDYRTINGTALTGSDYTTNGGTLTFAAGETTNTIEVDLIDNALQESTETFQVRLINATNCTLAVATNTVSITDDDGTITGFDVASLSVAENTNSVTIRVVRTGATNTEVSLAYATLTNGTATVGSDFRATNGVLVFAAGVTTNTFALAVINDLLPENNETINLRLTSATNTTLGTNNLTVTILTNDSSVMSFTATTNLLSESHGTLTVTVIRTGTTNNTASVDFFSTNVTALAGDDYTATNATATFAPGVTTNTFTVAIDDDDLLESTETFRLVLSNPSDGTIGVGTNTVSLFDNDANSVGFDTNAVALVETNDSVTLTVIRTGATNTAVSVDFRTINGTALTGSDYTTNGGTLTFAAGERTNTIEIDLIDNALQESTETFQVRLSNATNCTLAVATNTVSITDDDGTITGFDVASLSVAENTNSVTIRVVRTGATNTEVSLAYATLTNGTATVGADFRATNGVLVFSAGVTTNTFALAVINDLLPENNETINLRLTSATNTTLGTNNLTVTILTNDSSVMSFTATTNLLSESAGTLTVTVIRTGTTNNTASVDFFSTNVTATAGDDYTATNGTATFAPGVTTNTFTVAIDDDDSLEPTETFRLVLTNPSDGTIGVGTNTVSLFDNDANAVGFDTNAVALVETNDSVTLTVIRTGATNTAVSVDYRTINGTALTGSDYTTNGGTLTFAAGETTNTIEVDLIDNALQESTETFQVRLINATNCTLAVATNTVSITDDDGTITGFDVASLSVAENTNSVTIRVVRTGATNTEVSLAYATLTNGTATVGSDFRATNGVLVFAAGVTTNTFALAVINDLLPENNETINLRLTSATNTTLGTNNLTVTILTNDSSVMSFTATTNLLSESHGTLTVTVIRTGTTNNTASVDFFSTNVTATAGDDYTATNGTATFAPGVTTNTFTVAIDDDDSLEPTETFRLMLTNPSDGTIGVGTNTVSLFDNDANTVGFDTNAVALVETNDSVTLTVIRTGATNTAVTVDYRTINGTALTGSDYTTNGGTLTFAAGETTNTIEVDLVDNALQESTETFQVRLSNISNANLGVGTNTVSITDDDGSTTGFDVASVSVAENTNSVTIRVVRTGATNTEVSLAYATLTNGTATVGSDFRATNGVMVFAAGVTTNTFALAVINDLLPENNETINLRLTSATNTTLGTNNLTVTILTNDSSVMSFTATTNLLSESHGTLTVAIIRTGTTNNAASVDFYSTNVTATAGDDYTATNGTATFAPGETTNTFTVAIDDDDLLESTETFRLVLTNPSDGTIGVGTNTVSLFDNDASTVGFDTNAVALVETNDSVTLTVIRTGATNTAVTVDFRTVNGTALTGSDYTTNSGTLTFAAGETTNTIEITLLDNALQESTETFQVRLSNISNANLGVGTNTVSITDDDGSTTGFDVASLSVAENTNSVTIRVVRTGATNTEVSLAYATLTNGTATVGSDFRATNGVLVFAAGVTTNTFALAVINDLLAENNETINLRLTSATNTTLGTNNLTVTILTNDSSVMSFTATTNLLSESHGTLTVAIIRTGTTNNTASVDFFSTNVTATAGDDYTATNGTATFAPGETTNTFTVAIDDDDLLESTETFRLVLTNPSDGTIGVGTNTVSLFDNDASTVGFDTNAVALVETNDSVTLTVIRTGATNTAVSVDYRTINGTALTGSDYTTNGGTLTFAAGETTNTIEVDLIDNALQESTETFQVRLSNATNCTLAVATNTVSITDDDGTITGFDVASLSVAENTNSVTIRVVRTGATNTEVSLAYATLTNGTATVGSDYRATNGVLVFAAGVTTNTFALAVINDLLPENNETINLRLTSATNTTLGTNNLTVTILTNDSSVMSFTATTNLLSESHGTLTVAIIRTGTTNNTASVDFFSTNVTATAGDDYTATNGTATFAPGVTTNTFTVAIEDDDLFESTETFRLVLTNPSDGTIGVRTNTVSLFDNDANSVGFDTNAVALVETNDSVTLTVIRTGATNTAVSVDYRTINGTALTGSDYTTNGGTLTFAAGETTNTIEVDLIDNALQESTETFQVRLSNISNANLGVGTNTVSITDDDGTITGFDVASLSVAENTNSVTIRVVRTGATNTEVSLAYATLTNGTATVGSDFRATNGVLVFAAGVTTNTFALAVINDLLPENNETINLRLTSATNTTLGTNNLTVTILTNDSSVMSFTATTNLLSESHGTLTVAIIRTGTTNNAASVDFFSTNITAIADDDYTATNGTAVFAPGETTNTFTVAIEDDDLFESTETFRLMLTNPTDGTIGIGTNTVSLFDNDASTVGFDTNAVALVETNDSVILTVIRTGATNTAVTVDYRAVNVTALTGSDYTTNGGTLTFAAGETTNTIEVTLLDDLLYENDETFRVILSNLDNASLGTGTNTVTLTDDDASYIGFTEATASVGELDGSVTLILERTGKTNTTVSVAFATSNLTAIAGVDYVADSDVVTFEPDEIEKTITIFIEFDEDLEDAETFKVRLLNFTNAAPAVITNSTVTIIDAFGDKPPANLVVSINSIQLIGTAHLRLLITGPPRTGVSIESTSDFKTWVREGTGLISNGVLEWIVPIDPAVKARYFRVVPPSGNP